MTKRREKSQQKKELLLKLAEAGEKRPNTGTAEGRALNNYTTRGGNSYDPAFDVTIRSLRGDWFRGQKVKTNAQAGS